MVITASRRRCKSSERKPLPGEVVSRRKRPEKKEVAEETPLSLDPPAVLALKPERRLDWLKKALRRLQQGKLQSNSFYDILVHAKFPKDATEKTGARMYSSICAHIDFFSSKQQNFLKSGCKLAELFKDKAATLILQGQGDVGDVATCDVGDVATGDDDLLSSDVPVAVSGGDGGVDIDALLEKVLTSTADDAQRIMDTLDGPARDRLEKLLMARIVARSGEGASADAAVSSTARNVANASSGSDSDSSDASSTTRSRRSKRRKGGAKPRAKGGDRQRSQSHARSGSRSHSGSGGKSGRKSKSRAAQANRRNRSRSRSRSRGKNGKTAGKDRRRRSGSLSQRKSRSKKRQKSRHRSRSRSRSK